jgi:hypothetical protein
MLKADIQLGLGIFELHSQATPRVDQDIGTGVGTQTYPTRQFVLLHLPLYFLVFQMGIVESVLWDHYMSERGYNTSEISTGR